MGSAKKTPDTVWQALDRWAEGLTTWQRKILALAIERRRLSDAQIDEVFELFLEETGLAEKKSHPSVKISVSGRPAPPISDPLRLNSIAELVGVNALPEGASITFGAGLTVVYGRNGAGKSGFARLCANVCFTRDKPEIMANIYAAKKSSSPSAVFHYAINGEEQRPFAFTPGKERPELRRISVFDATGAQQRISESAPFEFRPAGFDVFPEMARVYGALAQRLEAAKAKRTHDVDFSESFIGEETEVSKAVAGLGPKTDLTAVRALASYGRAERARFSEVDKQLTVLKSKSPAELIKTLQQAKGDVAALKLRLTALGNSFSTGEIDRLNQVSNTAKKTAEAAAAFGMETFKRSFFRAVGTSEWQTFAKAAHALAARESASYPGDRDRCLLCERPLDADSRRHVTALLAFVEGDAQRAAEAAAQKQQNEVERLSNLNISFFDTGARVREHVHRLDPTLEEAIAAYLAALTKIRGAWLRALRGRAPLKTKVLKVNPINQTTALIDRITADIERLRAANTAEAIFSLETERQNLRHREVLSQLFPRIEIYVRDLAWCGTADRKKPLLNAKPITEKEKEIFSQIVGENYRQHLTRECERLDCTLPIELQTVGQKGQTMRSLVMKGGYPPEAILSEGEQKAVALADFLTEVGLNPDHAGIILDDPVTSQDLERKELIATRLIEEARGRQVIIFTHDLVFLNMLCAGMEKEATEFQTHWIQRDDGTGQPGIVAFDDAPATSKYYDTTERAKRFLADARKVKGTPRDTAIRNGMGALRRTIEETVAKRLLKGVVSRWNDRVIVTGLKKIDWNDGLVDELIDVYEELSKWIIAHSHTEEGSDGPVERKDLETKIAQIDTLIARCKRERGKKPQSPPNAQTASGSTSSTAKQSGIH